jgi:hypothetical protein
MTTATDILTLLCDVCKQPVTIGQGYICVDDRAATQLLRETQEEERRQPSAGRGIRLTPMSEVAARVLPWHIYHFTCDPDLGRGYWLDLPSANTYKGLLARSAHLAGKNWFPYTDWGAFVYKVIAMND